jgi:hypothetical protein
MKPLMGYDTAEARDLEFERLWLWEYLKKIT